MNKSETIDQIARSADIPKTAAKLALDALEAHIKAHSDAGERVMLRGLGSFSRGAPAQKTGRNPRTGQPLTYTSYHRVTGAPSFSESKLYKEISDATQLSEGATKRAIDAFKGIMKVALKKGDMASFTGFGCFYVGMRAARNGRNPQTGAAIMIAAAKVPKFRSSKTGNRGGKFSPASALKDAVN